MSLFARSSASTAFALGNSSTFSEGTADSVLPLSAGLLGPLTGEGFDLGTSVLFDPFSFEFALDPFLLKSGISSLLHQMGRLLLNNCLL